MLWIGILFGLFAAWCVVGFVIEAIQARGWRHFIVSACVGIMIIGAVYLILDGSDATASEDICIAKDAYGCIK